MDNKQIEEMIDRVVGTNKEEGSIGEKEGDRDIAYEMACPDCEMKVKSPKGSSVPCEGSVCLKCGAKLKRN